MPPDIHRRHLENSLTRLLVSGDYSDLTIVCTDGTEYKVHKAVLCGRSIVFDRELRIQMVESLTDTVKHEIFSSTTVGQMVSYCYRNEYTSSAVEEPPQHEATGQAEDIEVLGKSISKEDPLPQAVARNTNLELKEHIRVYAIADYYDIEPLRRLSIKKFSKAAEGAWQTVGFAEVVQEAYTVIGPANRDLRDAIVRVALTHKLEIVNNEETMIGLRQAKGIKDFWVVFVANVVDPRQSENKVVRKASRSTGAFDDDLVVVWDPLQRSSGEQFTG